jgi:hypothetical protein
MASANPSEINIQNLPFELKEMILKDLSDDDLIKQTQIPGLRHAAIDLLRRRLDNLSIRNLVRLYRLPELRIAIGQYYARCLLSLNYKKIKEIYQNETDPNVRAAIEGRIQDVSSLPQQIPGIPEIPENFNVIQKIDAIRALIFANRFIEIIEENGGLFNLFDAMSSINQRNMTSGVINMSLFEPNGFETHSYSLGISISFDGTMCTLSRGHSLEGNINCESNAIFQRLLESIELNYTLNDISINTRLIGNNILGDRIDVYNI